MRSSLIRRFGSSSSVKTVLRGALRLFRVFRLAKLVRYSSALQAFMRVLRAKRRIDRFAEEQRRTSITLAADAVNAIREIGATIRGVVSGGHTGISNAVMDQLPALQVVAINGVGTDAVDLAWPGGALRLNGLRWQGLALAWSSAPGAWLALRADSLTVDSALQTTTPEASPTPAQPLTAPRHLRLPLGHVQRIGTRA